MERNWSEQQENIFKWFENDKGALVIRARAGTGKTTTVLEGVNRAPEDTIVMCAFNKSVASELSEKIKNPYAEAKTLHGLGFACVRRFWDKIRVANGDERVMAHAQKAGGWQAPDQMLRMIAKLATKGKEMAPLARSSDELMELAYDFDCVPDDEWDKDGWDVERVAQCAFKVMELACQRDGSCDFSDMLYLPIRNRWVRGKYGLVVVDEAQDMNMSQLILAQRSVIDGGRIAVIGDDRQAIYGFRGADSGSIDRLKEELKAIELGLTLTYRCPKKVVSAAAMLVPDYCAADTAPDGDISTITQSQMLGTVGPTDFVLSRANAPLAHTVLKILRQGTRARIQGKEIGEGLIALTNKWKAKSMPEFLMRLNNWAERECVRAEASNNRGAERRCERIKDQAETLIALSEGLSGVAELKARIQSLFADNGEPQVICSSVHRAKGLEANRVFLLQSTFRGSQDPPCQCGHWAHEKACKRCGCGSYVPDEKKRLEERNIEYVAITRARDQLFWVKDEKEG